MNPIMMLLFHLDALIVAPTGVSHPFSPLLA
jgi:hypothetical protein